MTGPRSSGVKPIAPSPRARCGGYRIRTPSWATTKIRRVALVKTYSSVPRLEPARRLAKSERWKWVLSPYRSSRSLEYGACLTKKA